MKRFEFDVEKMENSPLRKHVKLKNRLKEQSSTHSSNRIETEVFEDINFKQGLNNGFKPIEKSEYFRIAKQLTQWNVSKSGAVIKREGPTFVKWAVDITLQNIDRAESPRAYFRGVLKKLQLCLYREC